MNYPDFPKESINFLINNGGLGDSIARIVPIKYIINQHPHVHPILWVPDYFFEVARNVFADEKRVTVMKFSDNHLYDKSNAARATEVAWFTNLKMSMVDHAFCLLANQIPEIEHKNYLQLNLNPISINKFKLPKKFVVMTVAYTAEIRKFLPEYVNEINRYIKSIGYDIVFLGQEKTSTGLGEQAIKGKIEDAIDFSVGLNLVNKTTLLEAAKIISKSACLVGLDSGLTHLAAMTDAPVVCGYTSVDPVHRMPIRHNQMGWSWLNVVPPDFEPEKFMQSRWDFCFDVNFTESYYKNDSLIRSLKPELWIEKLERIL